MRARPDGYTNIKREACADDEVSQSFEGHCLILVLVNIILNVHFVHAPGVEEDQGNKNIDGALLGKPESQFESAHANGIKLIYEQDAEAIGTNKPDDHAAGKKPQVRLPICFSVFRCHLFPGASGCCWESIYQSIMHYSEKRGSAPVISASEPEKKTIDVLGKKMTYVEMGEGDPIVFQHGNPTSSYLWRNIMPHLANQGRCIAVDLIGMGDSDKIENSGPDSYRYVEQRDYLFAAWAALGITNRVTLVIHDWGSALGFNWACQHPDAVLGIAYMEGIVAPVKWSDWPEAATGIFKGFRSESGESMILEKNMFVERVLPGSIIRPLTDEEMTVYRRPFLNAGEDRRPTLTWPRQIPLDGEPQDVHDIVQEYANWLKESDVPKLFINAEPGAILTGPQREFCRQFRNQTEVTVPGNHFLQEDSPHEIGKAIANWRRTII